MKLFHTFSLLLLPLLMVVSLTAKDQPMQVVTWPETGNSILRFSFSKFKEVGSVGNEHTCMTDTTVENLSSKAIPGATFSLYLFDKNKVRIGEGWVLINNVGPGETVKFQTTIRSAGNPTSLALVAKDVPGGLGPKLPPKTISITVNSVPQGASVDLDGESVGTTPKLVRVSVGKHLLEFRKEGFNPGKFPLEIGSDDVSGGSVSYELGSSAHDTVELRDGSVLSGDVQSVSGTEVVVRVGGNMQTFSRNQVKRILLIEREAPTQ